jgi:glycosyltransferase involved in cell wall biosynthesis
MVFSIFSHVQHGEDEQGYFAYAPYVNEMNIWLQFVTEVRIVAPTSERKKQNIDGYYKHKNLKFLPISSFSFTNFVNGVNAIFAIPKIMLLFFIEMKKADHIHLRCPGNIGLLACIVQIFFPKKAKTIKYAGNWDPKSKQPLSYKLQKAILSSTFLTKNAKVLVYGSWPDQSKNIVPFFTATYSNKEIEFHQPKYFVSPFRFIFVGTLSKGKNISYAIQLIEKLNDNGFSSVLNIYGEGKEYENLLHHINHSYWKKVIHMQGNVNREDMKKVYKTSHFLILASKSEGWPKVVAEAMFWGCLPIATPVSCVSDMLHNGERGIILSENLESDIEAISNLCKNGKYYNIISKKALAWSQHYTTDLFEDEVIKLLKVLS